MWEQRLGWGSAVSRAGGDRMGPRYCFPVTPLWRSPSPPSHILLVLARVSSCCLQFLNPFGSRQRFLAAEVAAGQAGLGGAPEAAGNLGWGSKQECPCSLRDGQSLVLLCVLPSLASSPDCGLCGATGAAHPWGSQVPHTSTLLP